MKAILYAMGVNICVVGLSGCANTSPPVVFSAEGVQASDLPGNGAHGEYIVLAKAFTAAETKAMAVADNPASAAAADVALYQALGIAGMDAVDGNCSDFFISAGEREKYLDLSHDVIGWAGALATGAVGIAGGSKYLVGGLGVTTATAYNGVDIYTRNFLFGTDNIDSVDTLIKKALDAHRSGVLSDKSAWTFGNAIRVILDHQEICRPSAIVALVRSSIKNGTIVAAAAAGSDTTALSNVDRFAELEIARDLGYPGGSVLDSPHLAALYWLYVATPPSVAEMPQVQAVLGDVPTGPFLPAGRANPAWNAGKQAAVINDLGQLSSATVTSLKSQITDWQAKIAKGEAPTPSPVVGGKPDPIPPVAPKATSPEAAGSKHISVMVAPGH